jgi:hypothetical protein
MRQMKNHIATPHGFARLIIRGVHANFAPENQKAELDRLAEIFQDMAMSRDGDAQTGKCNTIEFRLATSDAAWLSEIGDELDEAAFRMKPNAKQ